MFFSSLEHYINCTSIQAQSNSLFPTTLDHCNCFLDQLFYLKRTPITNARPLTTIRSFYLKACVEFGPINETVLVCLMFSTLSSSPSPSESNRAGELLEGFVIWNDSCYDIGSQPLANVLAWNIVSIVPQIQVHSNSLFPSTLEHCITSSIRSSL